jgi:hypothetical protein
LYKQEGQTGGKVVPGAARLRFGNPDQQAGAFTPDAAPRRTTGILKRGGTNSYLLGYQPRHPAVGGGRR